MCDDLAQKLQLLFPEDQLYTSTDGSAFYDEDPFLDYGLYPIENKLKELSRFLDEFCLPTSRHGWIAALNRVTSLEFIGNSLIDEQLAYDAHDEKVTYRTNYALFNSNQKHAFDTIVDKLQSANLLNDTSLANSENAISFFLHGPAGTEKSFVYNTLSNYLHSQGESVLWVASFGIASSLYLVVELHTFALKFLSK